MGIVDRMGLNVDGSTPQTMVDLNTSYAIKIPVRVATTAAITLSGDSHTIDGVSVDVGDRVLVKDQSDDTTNGIYVVSTGDWSRSADADGNTELINGTLVLATNGTFGANKQFRLTSTTNPVVVGTTSQAWSAVNFALAEYAFVTAGSVGGLPNARQLAGESTVVTITDGGAGGSITVSLTANGVTNAKLRQSAALSLIGRSADTDGNVADIVAGSDFQVFRRSGSAIGFGAIDLSQSNAVGTSVLPGVNGGTGVANTGKTITLGGNLTTSGAYALTLTLSGATTITLPTTGTVATLAGSEALTNKTYNGNTWTSGTGTLTLGSKTLTVSNSLTLAGTDGTTITFPSTSATVARTDTGQTFTGTNAFGTITFGVGTITGLTLKGSPNSTDDYIVIYDAAGNAIKKATVGSVSSAAASGITAINGITGAFTTAGPVHATATGILYASTAPFGAI